MWETLWEQDVQGKATDRRPSTHNLLRLCGRGFAYSAGTIVASTLELHEALFFLCEVVV